MPAHRMAPPRDFATGKTPGVSLQHALGAHGYEPGARADPELRVDPGQVHLDGLGAEQQLGGDLAVGPAGGHEPGDRLLLRREVGPRAALAPDRLEPAR